MIRALEGTLTGDLADGEACSGELQCKSGSCAKAGKEATCGVCEAELLREERGTLRRRIDVRHDHRK